MAADHVRPEAGQFTDAGQPMTFRITRRAELVTALKQRTLPIIIENEELAHRSSVTGGLSIGGYWVASPHH